MAADKTCCVLECKKSREDGVILHKFPNPAEDPTRFQTWLQAVGGNLKDLDDMYVFKYRRICHTHFESRYWTRSKMLSNIAIPTLQMTAVLTSKCDTLNISTANNQFQELQSTDSPSMRSFQNPLRPGLHCVEETQADYHNYVKKRVCNSHFLEKDHNRVPEAPDRESSCQTPLSSTEIPMTEKQEFEMVDRASPPTISIDSDQTWDYFVVSSTKSDTAGIILTPVLKEHNYYASREKPVKPRHENLTKKYSPRVYSSSSLVMRMRTQIKQMRSEICRLKKRCLRFENALKLSKSAQNSKPFCSKCSHCQQQKL